MEKFEETHYTIFSMKEEQISLDNESKKGLVMSEPLSLFWCFPLCPEVLSIGP